MREGAPLLLASSVGLILLLSFGQAARQGQDMKCGGMRASFLLNYLCTAVLTCPPPSQPAGLWWMRWSGPFPRWAQRK